MCIPTAVKALFFAFVLHVINATDVDQCCRKHQIPDVCAKQLCNPSNPPDEFSIYEIFDRRNNCSKHLKTIAQCLADGRNHSHCCTTTSTFIDEGACFGLCQGDGQFDDRNWKAYQTCLAINLGDMFKCFIKGYGDTPSPPQHLAARIDKHVHLSWSEPLVNLNEVDQYEVVCVENDSSTNSSERIPTVTRSMNVVMQDLQPGTKYYCYVVAVASDGNRKSLPSDKIHFQTNGVAPKMSAHKEVVSAPLRASTLLACHFSMAGDVKRLTPVWYKKTNELKQLRGPRYNITYYNWNHGQPREYIAMLEISEVQSRDYGTYQCEISYDSFKASAEVKLVAAEPSDPSSVPPVTVFSCCENQGISSHCISLCGSSDQRQLPILNLNCAPEINKALTCAMPSIDDSACCLKKQLPSKCMYLCDNTLPILNDTQEICKDSYTSITVCRHEGALKRPTNPKNLKISTSGTVTWDASERAEVYHLYWRRQHSSNWTSKNVDATSMTVKGADEVVVVAVNPYGLSEPSKLTLVNGRWLRS
uniref:Ig-like domain-containing protein n=1 Tax=Panagrellus redivivus TaxID=6233 RepID=A0A7E4ULF8_PANRE